MRTNRPAVMLFLVTSLLAPLASAATFQSIASGDWNSGATWNQLGATPASTDDVVINDGHTVTVTTSTDAAQSVIFGANSLGAALNINTAATLTVTGDLTINADTGPATVDAGAGTVIVGGDIDLLEGSTGAAARLRIGSGGATAGNVTFTNTFSAANTEIEFYGAGMLTLSGNLASNGKLTNYTTTPGSTVKYAGTTAQSAGDYTYQNLGIANTGANGVGVTTSLTVNGTLGILNGFFLVRTASFSAGPSAVLQMGTSTYLKLGDAVTAANVPMPTFASYALDPTSTIYYGSVASQTINADPPYANLDVVFTGSAGSPIKQLAGNTTVAGNLNIDQQTPGTVTLDVGTNVLTIGGTLTGDGGLTFSGDGEIKLAGNNNHTGAFSAGIGTFTYEGGALQNTRNAAYNDLVITGTNTNAFVTASGGSAVTLTVQAGAFFDINSNFTVSGTLTVDGTINNTGDLLTLSNSAGSILGSGDIFASVSSTTRSIVTAADLHFWGSFTVAAGETVTNNGTIIIDNNLAGTDSASQFVNASNATASVGGFVMTTGVLNAIQTGNTFSYSGLGQTVKPTTYHHLILTTPSATPGLKSMAAFPSLIVNGGFTISGAANFTAPSALDLNGSFTLAGTATFDAGSFTHTVAGDWTISGGTFTPNTSNITFDGTSLQTISASPFHDLWFDNTGSKKLDGNLDLSGDLAVLSAVPVNGNSKNLSIGGSFSDGNATATGIGTVTMDGTGAEAINRGSFTNLIIAKTGGGSILLGDTVNVSGDFHLQSGTFSLGSDLLDVNGNFDLDPGTTFGMNSGSLKVGADLTTDGTIITGTGNLSIDGTGIQDWTGSAPPTIHNLTVSKFTANPLNLALDVTVDGYLNLDEGAISTGTNKLAHTNSANFFRSNGYVDGEFDATHTTTGAKLYPMGTILYGYSPIFVTIGTPGQLPVRITGIAHPANTSAGADILNTYWTLGDGTVTGSVDLAFDWPTGAVNGTENSYVIARHDGSAWSTPGGTVDPTLNTASISGVSAFTGDWTLAAPASVSSLADLEITHDGTAEPGVAESITITAKDSLGNTLTGYSGDHILVFSGATTGMNGDIPEVLDKAGFPQDFGANTTLSFTNGVANTSMTLFMQESALLQVSEPSIPFSGSQYPIDVIPGPPTELAIVSVNDGNPLYENGAFTLSVEAHDAYGNYSNVVTNTTVDISTGSCLACTGSLSGTLSLVIPSGNVAANFSGLTYSAAESNVFLDATASAGDALAPGVSTNLTFNAQSPGVAVTTADDNVAGSLREAIQMANSGACGSPCNITFDILPAGAYVFQLTSRLPAIEVPVVIDGTTQDGYTGTPILAIDGSLFTGSTGFELTGGGSTLKGFILNNLGGAAVQLDSNSNVVQNCWIGTSLTGTSAAGNGTGISVSGNANQIGGTTAAVRNVISGNITGILLHDTASSNTIAGNYIGTNVAGNAAIGNTNGVWLSDEAISNTIGGVSPSERNVISGNSGAGVSIATSALVVGDARGVSTHGLSGSTVTSTAIIGNYIGLGADGVTDLGNGTGVELGEGAVSNHVGLSGNGNVISGNAIAIEQTGSNAATNKVKANLIGYASNGTTAVPNSTAAIVISDGNSMEIGGEAAADQNVIANNGGAGVNVLAGSAHTILGNSIPSYATLAIDLGGDGLDDIDAGDPDTGPNARQNAPTLSAAAVNGGNIDITTSLNTTGVSSTRLEFFEASASGAPVEFIGFNCLTGGSVNGVVSIPNGSSIGSGDRIVATATSHSDGTCSSVLFGTSEVSSLVTVACPAVTVNITGPTTMCAGSGPVTLDAGAGFASYLWSTGATTRTISVNPGTTTTYTVNVTDGNGCPGTDSHTVTVNALPTPSITGPSTACDSATLNASAGFVSYLWSTGATSQNITVTTTGTYTVTVTDANGCQGSASHNITVTGTPASGITAGGPTTFCQGGSVVLTSAAAPSYLWSTGETTQAITVTTGGSYSVQTFNGSCSANAGPVVVNVNPNPVINIAGPSNACGSTVLTGPAGFASYVWSNGDTTQNTTVTASGTYTLTVTDANGCQGSDTHAITITSPAVTITGPANACNSATLDAGTGFASYSWSTGQNTQSINVTVSGTYTVTVTDANGCTATDSHAITVDPNPAPIIAGPASACDSALLDAGPGFTSYLWSTGETTQSITVTTGGTYSVTVTAAGGCTGSDSHAVTIDPSPAAVITGPSSACNSAVLDAGPGFTGYLWSTGETTQSITVTTGGTYSVTVTGAGGCQATDSHAITINTVATPVITGPANACGSAVLDAGAGYSSYLWSTGETTQTITVTTGGTYNVTVTGAGGCTASDSHAIAVDGTPAPVISGPTSACGSAVLDAGPGYTGYLWSTGETTQTITVTAGGTYSVTVTASGGCQGSDSHGITINTVPPPTIAGPVTACDSAVLDAGAGYQGYLWSTGETTQAITVTATGTYSVTVTGAGGCTASDSHAVTVTSPAVTITGPANACSSAVLDAGAGFASYSWSTGETTQSITVTVSGTYSVTVTDANACTATDNHAVTVDPNPAPVISGPTSACDSAVLDAGPGYTGYLWSTGETTRTITVTDGGTYSVTVTGAGGCQGSDSHAITINTVAPPTITGPITSCNSAVLDAGAGYQGYLWSTGETTQTITVTATGTYSVTVTGAGGCTASDSHDVTIDGTLTPAISGPATACDSAVLDAGSGYINYLWSTGETTQTITVTASGTYSVTVTASSGCTGSASHDIAIGGPTPGISGPASACDSALLDAGPGYGAYLWSTGETTQTITVTTGGIYSVTVTDSAGCTGTASHNITIDPSPSPAITGPASACDSAVLDAGAGFDSYLWSTGETTQTITVTASGTYSVTVTGNGGCQGSDSHGITIGSNLTPVITGPATACDSATLDAGPGFQGYLWSTGETTQTITVTASGTYSVTVTGAGGCQGSDSHAVTIGSNLTPVITAPNAVDAGTAGHNASVAAQAGASYVWGISNGSITGGQGTSSITFKAGAAGTLNLTVSVTLNGCTGSDAHAVTVNAVAAVPDVKIVKSGPASVQAGAQFAYLIDVFNLGSTDLFELTMTDTLPPGVVVTNVAQGTWQCSVRTASIVCEGAVIPANSHRVITVTVNAPQQPGTITNTATISADINDPTPANNTSSVTTQVTEGPVNCSTVAPVLVAPADNATVGSPVTFGWNAVAGAFEYELWLVTNGVPQLAGTTAATSLVKALPSGTSSWYVVARFPGDCTPTVSAQRTFTVEQSSCGTPGAPQLTSPSAGSTLGQAVTFSWTPVPLAIGYRVWIEANGTAAQDVGVTGGAITLQADLPPGAIVAYVDALFSGCPPVRSATVAFNVARPDPCAGRTAAQLLAPANEATLDSSEVLFSWLAAAGADAYRVFISVGGAPFALLGETVETSLEASVPAGAIRWRVDALRDGCGSVESQEFRFTVPPRTDCSTAVPQPLSPANGSTTADGSVTFNWTAVANAIGYEVWLAASNGSPVLIGTTEGTSLAHVVSAGELEWFVRALGDRCPSRDSAPFTFTYTPSDACAGNQRPVPVSPLADARVTSPVTFEWTLSPGAVNYELFAFRGNVRTAQRLAIADTNSATVDVPAGRLRWFVRANFNGCSPLDSEEEKLVVVPPPAACAKLDAPYVSATGQVSSGVPFRIRWTTIPGATSYQLQLASNAQFSDAQTISTSFTRFDLTRTNDGTQPLAVFARVRAIDSRCRPEPTVTPYGPSSAIFILPSQGTAAAVPIDGGIVRYRIPLGPELAGQSFSVTEKEPWLTVEPTAGVVPANGTFLSVTADTTALPLGTSLGAIHITLDAPAAGGVGAHATTVVIPTVGVSKSTPVIPSPRSEPPPDALIIPAVAHATGINAQFQSDVRVTNSSAKLMNYEVTFTPSGDGGLQAGRQTQFAIEPGRTIALDDVLQSWFGTGGESAVGVLEIRPLADAFGLPPVSSAPFAGLTDMVTFASSRTFNATANGTFGQYIPAIPYASFIGRFDGFNRPTALSLQQIAQSPQYRTNLGIVEASGEPVSLLVSVFGDGGTKLLEFPVNLAGGQHTQLNGFLAANGITNLSDGRVEIAVTSPGGKVTAYASVLDNATNDPLLVTPVTLSETGNTKWVMPGVADITGVGQWQTDMRVFNAGTEDVETTMSFISLAGGEPRSVNMTIPAGEVRQFDRTLSSVFGITNDAGAVHISTPASARLVATGRTYNQASNGTYGQFISAVTPGEAAGIESRPLQLLQVEESPRFRSNLGLAEVTGNPVTLELSFVPPDTKFTATTQLTLGPNEFRQLGSVLRSVGMTDTFNARITVRVIAGTGRVTAYASVIDQLTNDPTYVPAQ